MSTAPPIKLAVEGPSVLDEDAEGFLFAVVDGSEDIARSDGAIVDPGVV